jgi:hypothetical protein
MVPTGTMKKYLYHDLTIRSSNHAVLIQQCLFVKLP